MIVVLLQNIAVKAIAATAAAAVVVLAYSADPLHSIYS
jgi:hypothetical protein